LQSQSDRDPRWLMLILWRIGVVAPVGLAIWLLYAAYYWPARLHEMRAPRPVSQATLNERYGADANMVALRLTLAAGCPKIVAGKDVDACV
jgi:hypothetical protein